MRKRHQAILISSHAKKNICNDLSLNPDSYEIEQKFILNNYFKENINPEDIDNYPQIEKDPENVVEEEENDDSEDISDEDENYISINSNIKVPPLGEQKGPHIKYEISEKALLGGISYDDYQIIPENKIKINVGGDEKKYNKNNINKENNEKKEERIIKVGEKIDFNDIIEQMAYWAEQINNENSKEKTVSKRNIKDINIPEINILQLFKLYPKKMDELNNKIKMLEKEMRSKNLNNDNCALKIILNEKENILNEKKQEIKKLSNALDKIKSITYGDKFGLIEFK